MKKHPFNFTEKTADIHVGLIGSGIQESRSPLMHMREAQAQGFSLDYRLFDLEGLGETTSTLPVLLEDIQTAGYAGVNVTHPCKQNIIEYLDELSPEAADLGAVNTVIYKNARRYGHNTDWLGFYLSFKKSLPDVATDSVLQLGAGGAGSAVAYALARIGVKKLYLYDVDITKAAALAKRMADIFTDTRYTVINNLDDSITMDGIINTTPIGMKKYPGLPLSGDFLLPRHWLADVIYFPLETDLLKLARNKGCKTMDGSGMAINQAAEAFRLFTSKPADVDRMSRIFYAEFQ